MVDGRRSPGKGIASTGWEVFVSDAASPDPTAEESSDAALISRVRAGDSSASATLYERHAAAARTLARHLTGAGAAEDVVREAFAKVLDALRRGGGPRAEFRPYLLTAVRRTVDDRRRSERRPTDRSEEDDPGAPFADPALEGLERSMVARAFRSLPERWRTVLWHTEVEGAEPAEVAPLLGLTPDGAAALAHRAREGLRQAYLRLHLPAEDMDASPSDAGAAASRPAEECRAVLGKLGAHVRGGSSRRESRAVRRHLDGCERCAAVAAELAAVGSALREVVGPLVLGAAAGAYTGAAQGGGVFGFPQRPTRRQQVLGGAAAALAAAVVLGLILVSGDESIRPAHESPGGPPRPAPSPTPPADLPASEAAPSSPVTAPVGGPPRAGRAGSVVRPSPAPNPPAVRPRPPGERLVTRIGVVGALLRDERGIVAFSVRNDGASLTGALVADVDLPPGVAYAGGATGRRAARSTAARSSGDGWRCRPRRGRTPGRAARVRCTRAPLPPGAAVSAYLRVYVAASAPYGAAPTVTVSSGGMRLGAARAPHGVTRAGLPARFAADGRLHTVHAGNALLTCDMSRPDCRRTLRRTGHRRDNDWWRMRPLDQDRAAATRASSAARVRLPEKSTVLWAGLYWSGTARPRGPVTVKLRPPGTSYRTVRAAEVSRGRLPVGPVYQAFADVTALVRRHGGGVWWCADPPLRTGAGRYAGWALVVVVASPDAPHRQAMVLDAVRARRAPVLDARRRLDAPVGGLLAAGRPGRVGAVVWEGDADLSGDRLLLDGRPLVPAAGDRDPGNVFDGSARGAVGPGLSFGVDVDDFSAFPRNYRTLTFHAGRDACLPGVVTVATTRG